MTYLKKQVEESESNQLQLMVDLRSDYDSGKISAVDYIKGNDKLQAELESLKEINYQKIKSRKQQDGVLFWDSWRQLIIAFGVRFVCVVLSLVISLLIADRNGDHKFLKVGLDFLQVFAWSLSSYMMIWVFWNAPDYPLDVYRYTFLSLSLLIGTSIVYLFKHYELGVNKLKQKIRILNHYIFNIIPKMVPNKERYKNEVVNPVIDDLHDKA